MTTPIEKEIIPDDDVVTDVTEVIVPADVVFEKTEIVPSAPAPDTRAAHDTHGGRRGSLRGRTPRAGGARRV